MVEVVCGGCGRAFSVEDENAPGDAICPYCGETAGGKSDADLIGDFQPNLERRIETTLSRQQAEWHRGNAIWAIAAVAVAIFIFAMVLTLRGDDWEQQHVAQLADWSRSAQGMMDAGDFADAAKEYRRIDQTLGPRNLESIYLKQLLNLARVREAAALKLAATATRPATQPAAAPVIAATEPNNAPAITAFQRAAEGWAKYLQKHPITFADEQGRWRRRKYTAWEVTAQTPPDTEGDADETRARMILEYDFNARMTAGHGDEKGAEMDLDFAVDEYFQPAHCRASYEFRDGKWRLIDRQTTWTTETGRILVGGTERAAALVPAEPELAGMENTVFTGALGKQAAK